MDDVNERDTVLTMPRCLKHASGCAQDLRSALAELRCLQRVVNYQCAEEKLYESAEAAIEEALGYVEELERGYWNHVANEHTWAAQLAEGEVK